MIMSESCFRDELAGCGLAVQRKKMGVRMSDVFQLATRYRSRLKAELAKVEEFLRMAEELSKGDDLEGRLPFSRNGAEARPAEPKAEAKSEASAEPKPQPKPAPNGEPKTPFDRFRAAGN